MISVVKQLDEGAETETTRQLYALKAFTHTADYDTAIAGFFRKEFAAKQQIGLRYGKYSWRITWKHRSSRENAH